MGIKRQVLKKVIVSFFGSKNFTRRHGDAENAEENEGGRVIVPAVHTVG